MATGKIIVSSNSKGKNVIPMEYLNIHDLTAKAQKYFDENCKNDKDVTSYKVIDENNKRIR